MDPYQASIEVVWHDPTSYDPTRHGPPYMPTRLASDRRAKVRAVVASHVAPKVAERLTDGAAPLASVLVALRAASFIHQTHHWQTQGSQSYADHLLFERLYNESQGFIDQVGERTVGLGTPGLVGAVGQARQMTSLIDLLTRGASTDNLVRTSLAVESVVLSVLDRAQRVLKESGRLTSGTSNLLEGASDLHETFVYLLSQRNASEAYDYGR